MDLVNLFRQELELCKLDNSQTVVVLSEPASRQDYVQAAFSTAQGLSSHVVNLVVPAGSEKFLPAVKTGTGFGLKVLIETPSFIKLLQESDMIIDLTIEGMFHHPVQKEILDAGTRVLFVSDPPEVLARNFPSPENKTKTDHAVGLLRTARSMHVTSDAGTDLVAGLGDGCHPGSQSGYSDQPGKWDHWPSAMVVCWPQSQDVNGTIVLAPGDIIFPFKEYVKEPVIIEIYGGEITSVKGGADAILLEQFFEDSGDPSARLTSHMGWGLMDTADWWSLKLYDKQNILGMDGRSAAGNFLISTGPHPFMDRWTEYHLDLPMRGCTIELDGVAVVRGGKLVAS